MLSRSLSLLMSIQRQVQFSLSFLLVSTYVHTSTDDVPNTHWDSAFPVRTQVLFGNSPPTSSPIKTSTLAKLSIYKETVSHGFGWFFKSFLLFATTPRKSQSSEQNVPSALCADHRSQDADVGITFKLSIGGSHLLFIIYTPQLYTTSQR